MASRDLVPRLGRRQPFAVILQRRVQRVRSHWEMWSIFSKFSWTENHLPKMFLRTRLPFLSKRHGSLVSLGVGVSNSADGDSWTSCPARPWTPWTPWTPLDAELDTDHCMVRTVTKGKERASRRTKVRKALAEGLKVDWTSSIWFYRIHWNDMLLTSRLDMVVPVPQTSLHCVCRKKRQSSDSQVDLRS